MRRAALAIALLAVAGCGSSPTAPAKGSQEERRWANQARALLKGLEDALPRISDAGVGPGTLADTSHLYSAVLGYTYVDSGEQLANLGPPSPRERDASALLDAACTHLHHASTLFSRAVELNRAALLASAATEALGTQDDLRRARTLLARIS